MKLRPYQEQLVDAVWGKLFEKNRLLVVAPPGAGKTLAFLAICKKAIESKTDINILIILNKVMLVEQTQRRISEVIPNTAVYCGSLNQKNISNVTVASIQSIHKADIEKTNLVILDECFSGDTEILTEKGFVRFDELNTERVVQVEIGTFNIYFVDPIRKIKQKPSSQVMSLKSDKKIDLILTQNHEMIFTGHNGEWVKKPASKINSNNYTKMMTCGFATGVEQDISYIEKFYICYQADGSQHYVNKAGHMTASFSFSKERKIEEFLKLMGDGGFVFKEVKCTKPKSINKKQQRRFLVSLDCFVSKDVSKHFDLKKLSALKCKKIIEYMNIWDGYDCGFEMYLYTTTAKTCADFYQSVACMAGYKTNLTKSKDSRSKTFNDVHRLFISKNNSVISSQGIIKEEVKYVGDVYCVEVPLGNIIVRRNGKTLVTGNCHNVSTKNDSHYDTFLKKIDHEKLKVIGFTATPYRSSGYLYGKGEFFDKIDYEIKIEELIAEGYLMRPTMKAPPHAFDTSGLKVVNGDFDNKAISEMTENDTKCIEQVTDALPRLVGRNKIAWACATIKHAEIINGLLENSVVVHSQRSKAENDFSVQSFEKGTVRHMVFVTMLSEGIDIPIIDALVMLRPTRSVNRYIQSVGRALRPFGDKKDALILDYGEVVKNCGPITKPIIRQKGERKKKEDDTLKVCPECFGIVDKKLVQCPECEYWFVKEEMKEPKLTKKHVQEFDIMGGVRIVEMDVGSVKLAYHKSTAGNECVRITYYSDSIIPESVDEYYTWANDWSRKNLQKRLIDLQCELRGDIKAQCQELVKRKPKSLNYVLDGKYKKVKKLNF